MKRIRENPELKFLAAFLFTTIGFMAVIFALAIIVDPYNIFGLNIVRPILLTNRTEKLELLAAADPKPEAIILGSSRVFKMDTRRIERLTGLRTFNASVSFARPEEDLAMTKYIVQDLGITPKLFLVGINIVEFNNDTMDSQTINNPNLRKYLSIDRKAVLKILLPTFKERFNMRYLRDIFVALFWNAHGFPERAISFGPDGGQIFDRAHTSPEPGAVALTANNAYTLLQGMDTLSTERVRRFEEFLAFAREKNIHVIVFLLPMPPELIPSLSEHTPYETALREFHVRMEDWKKQFAVEFFDFGTVDAFAGLPADFDDSTHPSHRNLDLMADRMFGRRVRAAR